MFTNSVELYIGNLDPLINEEALFNIFCIYGQIVSLKIMRHFITRESRGFGFIVYFRPHEARLAKEKMHGAQLMSRRLSVFYKEQYEQLDQHANLLVSNLPLESTDDDVEALFKPFGTVFSVKMFTPEGQEKPALSKSAYVQLE